MENKLHSICCFIDSPLLHQPHHQQHGHVRQLHRVPSPVLLFSGASYIHWAGLMFRRSPKGHHQSVLMFNFFVLVLFETQKSKTVNRLTIWRRFNILTTSLFSLALFLSSPVVRPNSRWWVTGSACPAACGCCCGCVWWNWPIRTNLASSLCRMAILSSNVRFMSYAERVDFIHSVEILYEHYANIV